jgi:hypothetical protein
LVDAIQNDKEGIWSPIVQWTDISIQALHQETSKNEIQNDDDDVPYLIPIGSRFQEVDD